jgi:hypothetical protein
VLVVTAKAAYFAVEWSDHSPAGRRHVHIMGRFIGTDHRMPSHDYRDLLKVTQALTQDARCLRKVTAQGGDLAPYVPSFGTVRLFEEQARDAGVPDLARLQVVIRTQVSCCQI